jgi:hypothetical protein
MSREHSGSAEWHRRLDNALTACEGVAGQSSHMLGGQNVRWDVSDDQAMELVGYEGKLPTTDRRPRFRLSTEQVRIVATLLEVDSALATAGLDPSWLHKRSGKRSRSPLDLMRAGAMDEVLRSLTQTALLASMQKKVR